MACSSLSTDLHSLAGNPSLGCVCTACAVRTSREYELALLRLLHRYCIAGRKRPLSVRTPPSSHSRTDRDATTPSAAVLLLLLFRAG